MSGQTKNELQKQIYLIGMSLLNKIVDISLKSVMGTFLWNGGITRISHSIPRIEFITCFSILFLVSMIAKIFGDSFMETAGISLFVLYQKNQQNTQLIQQKSNEHDN